MTKKEILGRRLLVIDTNVLLHDPTSIFRFQEHDIFLPMIVLEELDNMKKGTSEVARSARQTSRFLDELLSDSGADDIKQGLSLEQGRLDQSMACGKLFFQTSSIKDTIPDILPGEKNDNSILSVAIFLRETHQDKTITLVSKDINLRIKATVLGIHAEDYYNDQVLEDIELLYRGARTLSPDFWEKHSKEMKSWTEDGHTYYELQGPEVQNWHPSEFLNMDSDPGFNYRVCSHDNDRAVIEVIRDFQQTSNTVWGIHARNKEQNYALNLLMNPEIDFVTLVGMAGTGKTLLTLAACLEQTLEAGIYSEIIMTRVTVPVGEDIGFLPGTEEEKMTPWMGALMDNLEVLTQTEENGNWGQAATNDLLQQRIKIRSLNFMRGRTFLNKLIIIDEAQNLTAKQMKTLITRSGPGSKVICLGNIAQIDTPYLTETSSGLTYVVDRFKDWEHSGHITLLRGERSRLADFASEAL